MIEVNVVAWVSVIGAYLEKAKGAGSFADLVNELRLPLVAIWIGLLLGGFRIEQTGEFYGRSILLRY